MKALGILNKNYHELANYEDESYLDEAIAELEALQQPKNCEGCKYQIHKVDDVQQNGNWMKYSVFYDCVNDKSCKRNMVDRYEPKEQ